MIANIIHNPERKDRLQNILEQTAEQRIKYKLWPAVIDEEDSIRGCVNAHKQIVQWAKDNNESVVWIMEDDCVFTAPDAANQFLKWIPFRYKVYTAGMYGTHKFWHKGDGYWYPKSISGTHCYIVHSSFYDRFLSLNPIDHIDALLSKECVEPELIMNPELYALQLPSYSDILKQQVNYNNEKYLWQYKLYGTTLEEFNLKHP